MSSIAATQALRTHHKELVLLAPAKFSDAEELSGIRQVDARILEGPRGSAGGCKRRKVGLGKWTVHHRR